MAINLTDENKALSNQIAINPQAILEIEGVDLIFGAQPVVEFSKWDTNISWDQDGVNWDGTSRIEGSRDLIDLSQSTQSITQQILPDKGGSTSVSSVNVQLVDKDGEISSALSFDSIDEILGKRANFYIGFKQSAFPESAIPVFRGVVVDFYTIDGAVMVSIAHPEALKRQAIYQQYQSELDGNIDNSTTTINVLSTDDFIASTDTQTSCIKIEDEVMRVVSIDSATSFTVERAYEGTFAAAHDDEIEVLSIYIIEGKPIELALKMMLSHETTDDAWFLSDDKPSSIASNTLLFDYYDIEDLTGLVIGDNIRLTGVNAGDYTIKGFDVLDTGSTIEVNESLVDEVEFTDTFSYKSQYAVLGDGLGMYPFQVDLKQHLAIDQQNPALFVDYKFYIKDTIDDPQDFISREIYFNQGLYTINRAARASVKQVTSPLSVDIVPTINTSNITNITKIKQRRSLHKYLYNIYRYDYNEDVIEDKTLTKKIIVSQDSLNRIKGGRKQLKFTSKGLRDNPATTINIEQTSQRIVDRYRYAPTYFQGIQVMYSDGFNLEVGDVLPFGGEDTNVVDLKTGVRGQLAKLYEVVNKSLNINTGKITIDLLETSFNINARSAVISLSSLTDSGSTTTRIKIKKSFDVGEYARESDKWDEYAGLRIRVRSDDYTDDEVVTMIGVDPSDNSFLLLDTALSFTPSENYIVEVPEYDDTSAATDNQYKLQFAYFNAVPLITAVTSDAIFDVDRPDDLVVGSEIYVHNSNYSNDSFGTSILIESIIGNTVTLSENLPFTPAIDDAVEFSNFKDDGFPYQII